MAGATRTSSCSAKRSKEQKTLNDDKLANYMHSDSFSTIMTDYFEFKTAACERTKGTNAAGAVSRAYVCGES